ncbi:MAG: tungsten formylmethanofuran dehydrogenase [Rhodothermales bacterium]|nr:tungsten formylmethanofuran dehydrogenase [Rhodothermales bacterium]
MKSSSAEKTSSTTDHQNGQNGHSEPKPTIDSNFEIGTLDVGDFKKEDLRDILRTMMLSRALDDKMLTLLKQGKGFFHIGSSGHEAVQAAVGFNFRGGYDWFCTYYRDLCTVLSVGMTSRQVMLAHFAKEADPSSGGRQMSEHFGSRPLNIMTTSSSVGAQFLPALGFGLATLRDTDDAAVYCSCGEGATSQGSFHEALNWATRTKAPVLFLVQDNGYAISVPSRDQVAGGTPYKLAAGYDGLHRARVDGTDFFASAAVLRAATEKLRSRQGPVCVVADVVRLLPHSSSDDHNKYRSKEELEKDRQTDPIVNLQNRLVRAELFEQSDFEKLQAEVKQEVNESTAWAESQPDPDPSSATKYVFFEGDDNLTYESGDTENGEPIVLVDAINHAISEEMEINDRVIVFGEDVAGGKGGVFTATRGLTDKFGEDRCFNSPLAEASIIGSAVGFAAAGWKPVVEIQFADYIWPAMQQLRNQVAPFRYRSNDAWSCPMVIRVPCGGYIHGGLCHSQNIESIFGHTPGFKIAMPSTSADAKGLLKAAIRMQDPVIFLEHKALYRAASARSPEPDADYLLPFGKARLAREGTDLTVVSYGMMVHKSVNAARILEKEGVSVEVVDIRSIVPLDTETILNSVRKTGKVIVVYEDHEFIGFGAEIAAQIADAAFESLDAPVRRLAGAYSPIPFADPLEKAVLPQDDTILSAIRELASY